MFEGMIAMEDLYVLSMAPVKILDEAIVANYLKVTQNMLSSFQILSLLFSILAALPVIDPVHYKSTSPKEIVLRLKHPPEILWKLLKMPIEPSTCIYGSTTATPFIFPIDNWHWSSAPRAVN